MGHLVRGLLLAAAVYLAFAGALLALMYRPPEQYAKTIAYMPRVGLGIFPYYRMWRVARAGSLRAGGAAPDFELSTPDQRTRQRLSGLRGRPVLLIFSSYSSPNFRRQLGGLHQAHREYKDRVSFLMVYIQEAYASDVWPQDENARDQVSVPAHRTMEERRAAAAAGARNLKIEFPIVVDDLDNPVEIAYTAWPDRLYLIDSEGRVVWKASPGPVGLDAARTRIALRWLLSKGR